MSTPPTDGGDDLRALFRETVADVHPNDALLDIQSRTADTPPSPTRWLPLTIAAAAAVIAVIGGVAWFANVTADNGRVAAPDAPRIDTRDPDPVPRDRGRDLNVPVVYVGATAAGPRLFTEYHDIIDSEEDRIQAAVDEAFGARPVDPDYRNDLRGLGVTARVLSDTGGGDYMTLDLSGPLERPDGMDAETAEMVVQSLVWTVGMAASNETPVQFTVDSEPADRILGVDTSQPVARGSADSVLSTISIQSPSQGSVVSAPFNVRGDAATFEANVVWELKQGDRVVRNGFTTATECCTLSPYTFTVDAPAGEYILVVHDTDESDGEGIGTSQDTKDITVR